MIPTRGVGEVSLIFYSGGKEVPVTLDDMLVVPGCRCDILRLKARDCSVKRNSGNGVISPRDGKLNSTISGGLYCQVAYRTTRKVLRDDGRPPRNR